MKGIMETVLWTELLGALRADYPGVLFESKAGPAVSRVIGSNAEFMIKLSEENARLKERE